MGRPRAQQPAPPAAGADGTAPQAEGAAQQPVFRSGIDSVVVDVTVLDKQGNPVTDLKPSDFEVRESGKLQSINTFKFVQTDDGLDDPHAARDILSLNDQQQETARLDNRLYVIFLDDYHVRRENSMRVRTQLAEFLRQLSPHDLVAVTTPLTTVAGLTFSRNAEATSGMVRGFVGRKYEYTPMNAIEARYQFLPAEQQEQMRNNMVITALSNLCSYLGTVRDGRKTILYVSEGMSGSLPPGVRTHGAPSQPAGTPQGPFQDSRNFFDNSSLLLDLQTKIFKAATRNNVAIYTIDPRGLANFEYGVDEDVNAATDRRILQESTDLLRVIAEDTDGRAIIGRNDPLPQLKQMVRDSSAYYLLGYTSSLAPRDGKFHEIEVKVKRRDVDVRARKGYWAYSAEEIAEATRPSTPGPSADVSAALDDLAASTGAAHGHGRAVSVWMGARRGPAEEALVTFAWQALAPQSDNPLDTVDHVSIVADSASGQELFKGDVAHQDATGPAEGVVSFKAPPGAVRVEITPRNAKGLRLDADESSIEVPDFTATGPQLTTPFVFHGRTAYDLQQIRAAASPVPAVQPVFSRSERLLIRFEAYGPGGTTPTLAMRLLNQHGDSIATLPAPKQAAPSTFESELGLGSFPPGDYLVEIAATANDETAKQLVAIRVTG